MDKIWHKTLCTSIEKQYRRICAKDFGQLESTYGFNPNTVHFYKDHEKLIAIYSMIIKQTAHYGMVLQYRTMKSPLLFNKLFVIRYFDNGRCVRQKSTCE